MTRTLRTSRNGLRSVLVQFSAGPPGKIMSLDTFQLPGLVADAVKAIDDLGIGAELQLVFYLLRINDTVTQ